MHSSSHLNWLKENNLLELVEKNSPSFEKILKNCLNHAKEEILIIADHGTPQYNLAGILAGCYLLAARQLTSKTKLVLQEPKKRGFPASIAVIESLKSLKKRSLIVLCTSNKLGQMRELGKSFRRFCQLRKHRFISTTSLSPLSNTQFNLFMNALNIDYGQLARKGRRLKNILDQARTIQIKTERGTDLSFDIRGVNTIANIGSYHQPGQGGNLPAGEVYLPPHSANGKLVVDGCMRYTKGTVLVNKPFTMFIKDGKLLRLEGETSELLEESLLVAEKRAQHPERIRLIGELGLGINPGACLLGSTIVDEKVLGTAHIALGSNYWFGGKTKTILHLDQVFMNPQVYVDGLRIKI